MMENIEKRFVELRIDKEQGIVRGTAIVFNSESYDLGGFTELIKPEAITMDMLNSCDIVMLYNHNQNSAYDVLARSKKGKGSLKFTIDDIGVHFSFKVKNKDTGIIESIEVGDLDGCSFAFYVNEDDPTAQKWEKKSDGKYLRTVNKIESIRDFSIVVNPAYPSTSVSIRGLEKLQEEERLNKVKEDEEQRKSSDEKFQLYLKKLQKEYLS